MDNNVRENNESNDWAEEMFEAKSPQEPKAPKRRGGIIRKIVFAVSVVTIVACAIIFAAAMMRSEPEPEPPPPPPERDTAVNFGAFAPLPPVCETFVERDQPGTPLWTERDGYSLERNSHFVGWIRIGDTRVNYPVVQKTEAQYEESGYNWFFYIYRDFDRVFRGPQTPGTIFVDRHTPIINLHRPDNTVLYGHNMRPGTMFAHVARFYAPHYGLDAYITNPTIEFVTIYSDLDDVRNTYKIFAGVYFNTLEEHGEVFDYFRRRDFNSQSQFFDFIGNVMDRSVFFTEVDIKYGDEILTLSTCYFPLGTAVDSRFALFARRVRPGENLAVDTSAAHLNLTPLYFDRWYRVRGGSWQGRGWDTSKVRGFDEWLAENPDWCSTTPQAIVFE